MAPICNPFDGHFILLGDAFDFLPFHNDSDVPDFGRVRRLRLPTTSFYILRAMRRCRRPCVFMALRESFIHVRPLSVPTARILSQYTLCLIAFSQGWHWIAPLSAMARQLQFGCVAEPKVNRHRNRQARQANYVSTRLG